MDKPRSPTVILITALLAAVLGAGDAVAADPHRTALAAAPRSPADPSHTITLITGDRVILTGADQVTVHRGPGRDDVTFLSPRIEDRPYLIPADAAPLVASGRVDIRLFDVLLLREIGYHDGRDDLPLIVTDPGQAMARFRASGAAEVSRTLPVVNGAAVRLETASAAQFWAEFRSTAPATGAAGAISAATGPSVWLDGVVRPVLEHSVPQVGVPQAWAVGLDGTGATVAVIDSGIDATHPDLADRVVDRANFTEGEEDSRDIVGHGTHVASIAAGTGAASDGRYRGVAPGAGLLDAKACAEFGCRESWLLAGMQWAAEQGADVINMSLGADDTPGIDPVEQAVATLTEQYGALFVIAAGNDGPTSATIGTPGSAEAALTVGAVDSSDQLAWFSSRGPQSDGALKPDLTAPGVSITAANSADAPPDGQYAAHSGTSMAAPHVAGAAAILVQQHPDWTPEQLKGALMGSAVPDPDLDPYAQGAGRLDVARTVDQAVTVSPPSFSFVPESETDGSPQSQVIRYHNHGETDLTLNLSVAARAADGSPAGDGVFSLSASTVAVPAGASAEVVLTADGPASEVAGRFSGRVTATAPEVRVSTPFVAELRMFLLTLEHLSGSGTPTSYFTMLKRSDRSTVWHYGLGSLRIPLAAGEYELVSLVSDVGEDPVQTLTVLLGQPRLRIERNTTVRVDARLAQPIAVAAPEPGAAPVHSAVTAHLTGGGSLTAFGATFDGVRAGRIGPDEAKDGFLSEVMSVWARPHPDGGFLDSPYTYNLVWFEPGRMIHGFDRSVGRDELATVHVTTARQIPDGLGLAATRPQRGNISGGGNSVTFVPFTLPAQRIEYYRDDGDVRWDGFFGEATAGPDPADPDSFTWYTSMPGVPTRYEAGRRYHERWNHGVFAPVLPPSFLLQREGDLLGINPTLYGDGDGRTQLGQETGTVTVYRDGELLAELPELHWTPVEVPPEPAEYRVEVEAQRAEPFALSTRTSLTWTFRSAHAPAGEQQRLPVSVVRFTPTLDGDNAAPAGRPFAVPVPVRVLANPGSDAGEPTRLRVDVSFDDGATWRRVPVTAGRAMVLHPHRDGFVSLRASSTDSAGNSVEQTIIRAYRID